MISTVVFVECDEKVGSLGSLCGGGRAGNIFAACVLGRRRHLSGREEEAVRKPGLIKLDG